MTRHQLLGTLVALGAVTFSISAAQAQTCNATTDCPKSYICSVQTVSVSNCGGVANGGAGATNAVSNPSNPTPLPAIDAGVVGAAGSGSVGYAASTGGSVSQPALPASAGATGTPCTVTTQDVKQCVALDCTSDADCSVGWYCKANTVTSCPTSPAPVPASGSAGAGNAGAAVSSGASASDVSAGGSAAVKSTATPNSSDGCVVTTQSMTCQPKAINPCTVPADCGPGYDCVESTMCACSASASSGNSGSSTGPVIGAGGAVSTGGVAIAGSGPGGSAGAASVPTTASDCSCGPSGYSYCHAQTIACQTRTDCPDTWTCSADATSGTTAGTCISPLSSTSDKGYAVDGSQSTSTPTASNTTGAAGSANSGTPGSGAGGTEGVGTSPHASNSDTAASNGASGSANSQGGCQISHDHTSGFVTALLGLLAMFGMRRRRQLA